MPRPRQTLNPADEALLRHLLNLGATQAFPRCPGKSRARVAELAKAGQPEHKDRGHETCDECRCTNVAGAGTSGRDYFGIGRPDLGRYGVGFCSTCSKSLRRDTVEKNWREHLQTLQAYGKPSSVAEIEQNAVVEANRAEQNLEMADAIIAVREVLAKIKDMDDGYIDASDMDDAAKIGAKHDALKIKIQAANSLNNIAKTSFEFSKELHVPVDVMKIWVVDIINVFQRIAPTTDEYNWAVTELTKIMAKTRNPNLMMAQAQVSATNIPKRAIIEQDS